MKGFKEVGDMIRDVVTKREHDERFGNSSPVGIERRRWIFDILDRKKCQGLDAVWMCGAG